jgi:hypothetical protein
MITKTNFLFIFIAFLAFSSCKKETTVINQPVVDNYIYGVNGENLYQSNVEKDKQKTSEQYISILYANLFQNSVPQNDLVELSELRLCIGDKQAADELILNNFVNSGNVTIPSDNEMRADVDKFIEETYLRFFLRKPNAYETFELKKEIEDDAGLTPELIYQAFALSNEYKFY